jgi:hypothetical protein
VVTVSNASGAYKYYIDGVQQTSLTLHQHQTYIFDLSSPTLVDHPFVFQTTNANDGTTDGTNYTSGITTTGGYGSTEKRTFVVPVGAPTTLYYYCTAHSGMGGSVSISSEAELIVSGGAEFLGTGTIKVPSGTTDQRPATGINGMLRYNSQTGYMEAYTVSGWGSIATPPTIQTISPVSVAVSAVTTQVFTVTGAFFDAQTTIQLQGADSTKYDVTDFVFTNSGSIGFKMGTLASGQAANRPYKVVVTNGAGLTATSTATIGFSGLSWTTQTLNPYYTGPSSTQNLVATDEVGGNNVTFSIYSGSVSGLSLGSTGASPATYGGSTSSTGTTPVTFRVTDNVTGSTLDKTLSIVVQTPPTGEAVFTQPTSSTSWTVPAGVTSISAVVVGGGAGGMHAPQNGVGSAGGGGGLTYANQFSVTPGETLTVVAGKGGNGGIKISSVVAEDGGHSYIQRATTNINLIIAYSGAVDKSLVTVTSSAGIGGVGGGSVTNVSYQGGNGAPSETTQKGTRGAGQGGYGDDGGIATIVRGGGTNPSGGGTNGGGAGGYGVATTVGKGGGCSGSGGGGGGGGVNLYGTSTGTLPSSVNLDGSPGGLGGASSAHGQPGGGFGGGGGSADDAATQGGGDGGDGAVRIIWGPGRSFPSTNVGQSSSLGNVTYY